MTGNAYCSSDFGFCNRIETQDTHSRVDYGYFCKQFINLSDKKLDSNFELVFPILFDPEDTTPSSDLISFFLPVDNYKSLPPISKDYFGINFDIYLNGEIHGKSILSDGIHVFMHGSKIVQRVQQRLEKHQENLKNEANQMNKKEYSHAQNKNEFFVKFYESKSINLGVIFSTRNPFFTNQDAIFLQPDKLERYFYQLNCVRSKFAVPSFLQSQSTAGHSGAS